MISPAFRARIRAAARTGQLPRHAKQLTHPHGVDQFLFKPGTDAYYSAAEWADGTHLLADRRDGVGDLRLPRAGRCWSFDGVDDYGSLTSTVVTGTADATYCAWVKLASWPSGSNKAYIFGDESGGNAGAHGFRGRTSLAYVFGGSGTAITSNGSMQLGEWTHFAVTRSGATIDFYLDGQLVGTDTVDNASHYASVSRVGATSGLQEYLSGSLRDLRVYDSALSAAQIANIHAGTWIGSPVLYLPCEEEAGYTGFDASGNENHVTLNGITPGTFHAIDATVPRSAANERGYSDRKNYAKHSSDQTGSGWGGFSAGTENSASSVTLSQYQARLQDMGGVLTDGQRYQMRAEVRHVSGGNGLYWFYQSTNQGLIASTGDWQYFESAAFEWDGTWTGLSQAIGVQHRNSTAGTYEIRNFRIAPADDDFSVDVPTEDYRVTGLTPRVPGTDLDALGNDCQYKGPAPNPGLYLPQVMTGDGASVYVDCGSAFIPETGDFDLRMWYYYSGTNTQRIFDDRNPSGGYVILLVNPGSIANSITLSVKTTEGVARAAESPSNTLVQDKWYLLSAERAGSTFTLTVECDGEQIYSGGVTDSGTFPGSHLALMCGAFHTGGGATVSMPSAGRFGLVSITTGGVTRYVLPRGDRTVDVLGTDGSASTGTINGGDTDDIFANRGDGSWIDPRVEHGGKTGTTLSIDWDAPGDWTTSAGASLDAVTDGVRFSYSGSNHWAYNGDLRSGVSAGDQIRLRGTVEDWTSLTFVSLVFGAWGTVINASGAAVNGSGQFVGNGTFDVLVSITTATSHYFQCNGSGSFVLKDFQVDRLGFVPTKLDDSEYADGSAIDTGSAVHVPAQKFGDPNAQVDRTGGNSDTPFASDTAAPTDEAVADDTKTDTDSRCRKRMTNNYAERLGGRKLPQTDDIADATYGVNS